VFILVAWYDGSTIANTLIVTGGVADERTTAPAFREGTRHTMPNRASDANFLIVYCPSLRLRANTEKGSLVMRPAHRTIAAVRLLGERGQLCRLFVNLLSRLPWHWLWRAYSWRRVGSYERFCIGQQHLAQVWAPFSSGDLAFWLCNMSLLNTSYEHFTNWLVRDPCPGTVKSPRGREESPRCKRWARTISCRASCPGCRSRWMRRSAAAPPSS